MPPSESGGVSGDTHGLKSGGVNLPVVHGAIAKQHWMTVGCFIEFFQKLNVIERGQNTAADDAADDPLTWFQGAKPTREPSPR